jgi:hypothetical protein
VSDVEQNVPSRIVICRYDRGWRRPVVQNDPKCTLVCSGCGRTGKREAIEVEDEIVGTL